MSYQFNIEVVNAIPANACSASDTSLRVHCIRHDAAFTCASIPASFELRHAPDYDLLECALILRRSPHTVLARSLCPIVIGGPNRTVGATWIPLDLVHASGHVEGVPNMVTPPRVFVAWSMATMDGTPLCPAKLEVPPYSSTAPPIDAKDPEASLSHRHGDGVRSLPLGLPSIYTTTTTTTPASATATTAQAAAVAAADTAAAPGAVPPMRVSALATSPLHRTANTEATPADSAVITAHVSIVLDAAQEAAEQRSEGERHSATAGRRASAESMMSVDSAAAPAAAAGGAGSESGGAEMSAQQVQDRILAGFPHCRVLASASAATATGDEGVATPPLPVEGNGIAGRFVDYYATSTQSIGGVSLERRHHNLHLVPCALLLDRIKSDVNVDAGQKAGTAPTGFTGRTGTTNELWKVSHRHGGGRRPLGTANSAVESIRLEAAARGSGGAVRQAEEAQETQQESSVAHPHTVSSLTTLRQQAMASIRQRRVTYSM